MYLLQIENDIAQKLGSRIRLLMSVLVALVVASPLAACGNVEGSPTVSNIYPNSGPVSGGTSVTISGSNFLGTTAVSFGQYPATGCSVTSTSMTCPTPAASQGGIVDVTVTSPKGTSPTNPGDEFTYQQSAPVVNSVSPSTIDVGSTQQITIIGNGFTGATSVLIVSSTPPGYAPVTIVGQVTNTTVVVSIPTNIPAGTYYLVVTTSGSSQENSNSQLTISNSGGGGGGGGGSSAPVVSSISPTSGPTSGGTSVTITGTSFTGATAVSFGTIAATSFSVVSATQITAVSPPGNGMVGVVVATASAISAPVPTDQFTYTTGLSNPLPNIGSILGANGEFGCNQATPTIGFPPIGKVLCTSTNVPSFTPNLANLNDCGGLTDQNCQNFSLQSLTNWTFPQGTSEFRAAVSPDGLSVLMGTQAQTSSDNYPTQNSMNIVNVDEPTASPTTCDIGIPTSTGNTTTAIPSQSASSSPVLTPVGGADVSSIIAGPASSEMLFTSSDPHPLEGGFSFSEPATTYNTAIPTKILAAGWETSSSGEYPTIGVLTEGSSATCSGQWTYSQSASVTATQLFNNTLSVNAPLAFEACPEDSPEAPSGGTTIDNMTNECRNPSDAAVMTIGSTSYLVITQYSAPANPTIDDYFANTYASGTKDDFPYPGTNNGAIMVVNLTNDTVVAEYEIPPTTVYAYNPNVSSGTISVEPACVRPRRVVVSGGTIAVISDLSADPGGGEVLSSGGGSVSSYGDGCTSANSGYVAQDSWDLQEFTFNGSTLTPATTYPITGPTSNSVIPNGCSTTSTDAVAPQDEAFDTSGNLWVSESGDPFTLSPSSSTTTTDFVTDFRNCSNNTASLQSGELDVYAGGTLSGCAQQTIAATTKVDSLYQCQPSASGNIDNLKWPSLEGGQSMGNFQATNLIPDGLGDVFAIANNAVVKATYSANTVLLGSIAEPLGFYPTSSINSSGQLKTSKSYSYSCSSTSGSTTSTSSGTMWGGTFEGNNLYIPIVQIAPYLSCGSYADPYETGFLNQWLGVLNTSSIPGN